MDVKTYCEDKRNALTKWKARAYDLLKSMDQRSAGLEERASVSIGDLGKLIDQIEKKINLLEDQCPADWSDEKAELDSLMKELEEKWAESAELSPDDF